MPFKIPPLGAVRVFDVAARHLSFTRAAAELGVTQAAVSWQIKSLERRLNLPLFERRKTGLTLTATGALLASGVSGALRDLDAAFQAVLPSAPMATLRVSAAPTFANAWLVPRLERFRRRHPGIVVEIDATGELVDVAGGAADLAIRHGSGHWPGLTGTKLFPVILRPVCSPRLVEGLALPLDAETLSRLPFLQPTDLWAPWFAELGHTDLIEAVKRSGTYHQEHMATQAAIAGQGVAFVNPNFCVDALADGRLVIVAPEVVMRNDDGYWLIHRDGVPVSRWIKAFRDWILAELPDAPNPEHSERADS